MAALRQTTRTRVLAASRPRVWETLTAPATAAGWLGGSGAVELRTAGARSVLTEADGTVRHMLVDEVEPGERIVLRWWTDRGPGVEPSIVEIALRDAPEGTVLAVTETALADAPVREPSR